MNKVDINVLVGSAIVGLATLVAVLTNISKLTAFFKSVGEWFKSRKKERRVAFAKLQQPYCQDVCAAPKYMGEISEKLNAMFQFIEVTREISLETLGRILVQTCNAACERGYMSQSEKDDLIHSYIPYDIGGGNGRVLYHVGLAMDLPTSDGGPACDVDMSSIIDRERERYANKKNTFLG